MSTSSLSEYSFGSIFESFPQTKKILLACSGGMDSSVLLHLIYSNKEKIKQAIEVIYVDHGLQEDSIKWGEACKRQCQSYGLTFLQLDINESPPKGCSIEAWAREKRYSLIAGVMQDGDLLLTAHHQDDQVETFFLQALRGVGPRGLAAMPDSKVFSKGFHVRPLLKFKRSELLSYANDNGLAWCEDPSNTDTQYDRNYLRHQILPHIEKQWPAYHKTITRLVEHQQDTKVLLDELGREDLNQALFEDKLSLRLNVIKQLNIVRQKNLISFWLRERQLATPDSRHLEQVISNLINSKSESSPCVNWGNVELRRYKNLVYATESLEKDIEQLNYDWDIKQPLKILGEELVAIPDVGTGLSKEKIKNARIIIKYRQGGEKINPANNTNSKTLKQLFQENAVLPWLRDRYPLLYVNDSLALIPGLCVDKNYSANSDESSWKISWSGYKKAVQLE